MPKREDVVTAAQRFLAAVAKAVQTNLGPNAKSGQQAIWWSPVAEGENQAIVVASGSSTSLRSGGHEREVLDWFRVNILYQAHLSPDGFPEQTELSEVMIAAGVQPQWIQFGFLVPLVTAWCKLPEPFELTQPPAQALLAEFSEAVIDGTSVTRYRDAIVSMDLERNAIALEDDVVIRPIEEEELWDLGSGTISTPPYSLQLSPAESWCILDISVKHPHTEAAQIASTLYSIREAVVANLAVVVEGGFTLLPIGMTTRFGPNAIGTTTHGSRMPREFGRFPGKAAIVVDTMARKQLQEMWPKLKEIMLLPSHYLSLPLRRLVDGFGRARLDDQIVDYAIGLEALLTASARDELGYRLALRGATILEELGEDKLQAFHDLKSFYDARSNIVHGGPLAKLNLHAHAGTGERAVRKIWKWYLLQGLTLKGAVARVDHRILSSQ